MINEKCSHCKFIDDIFGKVLKGVDATNREYWLMTEVFVYLHNGKDFCDISNGKIIYDK
jgi:hypothetical protein